MVGCHEVPVPDETITEPGPTAGIGTELLVHVMSQGLCCGYGGRPAMEKIFLKKGGLLEDQNNIFLSDNVENITFHGRFDSLIPIRQYNISFLDVKDIWTRG